MNKQVPVFYTSMIICLCYVVSLVISITLKQNWHGDFGALCGWGATTFLLYKD